MVGLTGENVRVVSIVDGPKVKTADGVPVAGGLVGRFEDVAPVLWGVSVTCLFSIASPTRARPRKEETNGAKVTKTGPPMMDEKSKRIPVSVPPRAMTMMDRMKVTKKTGPATSHEAKPRNGRSATPHTMKMRIQAAFASTL